MKKPAILTVAVALLLALFWPLIRHGATRVFAHASKTSSPQENGAQPVIRFVRNPEPVAAFLAHDLDGNVVTPANWEGKVTLVVFWATWCPPCRAEIPELIRLQEKYPGQAQVIGVSVDEEPASVVKQFAEKAGINYPVVMATPDISRGFGGVPALPTTFMINPKNGVVL
jgi:thiol-disulfide isomerase/thioredoxin